jgi:hypothetical protein
MFAHAQAADVLIRGATVYTGTPQGVLKNADVLMSGGRIAAVGNGVSAPANATVIEAKGRPLTAGLFGGLSDIGLEEVSLESSTVDENLTASKPPQEMQWRPEFDVTLAFNPRSVLLPVARVEGLTWTVLTPGSSGGSSFVAGQGAAVTLDGRYDAALAGSRSLFIDLGSSTLELSGGSRAAQWMLLDQAIREVRAGKPLDEHSLLHTAGREAFARYLNNGRVVFNVTRAADIRQTIAFAQRNGIKPVIAGGAEAWVVADELARAKVPVVLNSLEDLPEDFDRIGARLDNAALLAKAGVRVAFSIGESHNARKNRQLAGNAVAHGLPWDAGLAGLTSVPAEIFGLVDRGRIAQNQVADLVLWSGDPLELTSLADQVWIAGKPVEMRSRQTELRDRYFQRLKGN